MLHKIVNAIQAFAVVATAVTVLFLFAGCDSESADTAASAPGADVFAANCASCHGSDGGGSAGPDLADGAMVDAYPAIEDEIAVITEGSPTMPAFADRLTPEEIEAVAAYTRDSL
jgi:mono/diheme cytochrome c family protein